jgi:uncharacterized protein YjbJ (UPF0337 family)
MASAVSRRSQFERFCRIAHAARKLLCTSRMNWNQIEGRWDQLAGQVKSQWAKLTDDDLKNIAGKRQQLVGKLQERYGVLKEDIEKQVNAWLDGVQPEEASAPPPPPTPRTPTN